jgi:uncharacterized protein (TIGR02301 family)
MTSGRAGASWPGMRRFIAILTAGLVLGQAGGALAGPRGPAERQSLIDLAYVLGESHALRQACAGPADQFWRARMAAMVKAEAPDPAFDRQLKGAFNTGFAATQSAVPRCAPGVRRREAAAAARGRALASSLIGPVAVDDPSR